MIKKICLVTLLFFGFSSYSEIHTDLNTEILTISKNDLLSLPLVFSEKYLEQMNQYFEYKLDADNKLHFNNKISPVYQIEITKAESDKVTVDFKDFEFWNQEIIAYTVSQEFPEKINILKRVDEKKSQFTYGVSTNFNQFCIFIKNRFSYLNLCRNLNSNPDISKMNLDKIKIKVNEQNAENTGVVLLQNLEKPVYFLIRYDAFQTIEFSVIKRIPLLNTLFKDLSSDLIHLEFKDYGIENSRWTDHIKLGQSFIDLKLNPILNVRQEIGFSNQVSLPVAIEDQYLEPMNLDLAEKLSSRLSQPHRRFSLGLQSSQYSRSDQVFDVSLVSKNSLSLQFSFEQVLLSKSLIDYSLEYTQSKIADNAENVSVSGSDISFYSIKSSFRKPVSELLHLSIGAGLYTGSFFSTNATLDGLESSSSQLLMIPMGAMILLNPRPETEIRIPLEYSLIFGGDQMGSGTLLSYGVEVQENIQGLNCFLGFRSKIKSQKYLEFNQNEDHFQTYLGFLF